MWLPTDTCHLPRLKGIHDVLQRQCANEVLQDREAKALWSSYMLDTTLKGLLTDYQALLGEGFPNVNALLAVKRQNHLDVAASIKKRFDDFHVARGQLIQVLSLRRQDVVAVEYLSRRFHALDSLYKQVTPITNVLSEYLSAFSPVHLWS